MQISQAILIAASFLSVAWAVTDADIATGQERNAAHAITKRTPDLSISFSKDINHKGDPLTYYYFQSCTNLSGDYNNTASSLVTGTRVRCQIFDGIDCTGKYLTLGPGSDICDLKNYQFNDITSSFLCDFIPGATSCTSTAKQTQI